MRRNKGMRVTLRAHFSQSIAQFDTLPPYYIPLTQYMSMTGILMEVKVINVDEVNFENNNNNKIKSRKLTFNILMNLTDSSTFSFIKISCHMAMVAV